MASDQACKNREQDHRRLRRQNDGTSECHIQRAAKMTDVPEVHRDRHIHAQKRKRHNCCAGHQAHGPDPYDNRKVIQDKELPLATPRRCGARSKVGRRKRMTIADGSRVLGAHSPNDRGSDGDRGFNSCRIVARRSPLPIRSALGHSLLTKATLVLTIAHECMISKSADAVASVGFAVSNSDVRLAGLGRSAANNPAPEECAAPCRLYQHWNSTGEPSCFSVEARWSHDIPSGGCARQ